MLRKVVIKKILVRVIFLLILFLAINFYSIVLCEEILKERLWYKNAVECIKVIEIMWQNAAEKKETFLEDYDRVYEAKLKLFDSPPPPISELEKLLTSGDILDKKIVFVTIVTKQIYSEELFKTIIKSYNPNDDLFTKHYFYQSFNFLDKDKIKILERDFVKILKLENSETAIITAMPTIIRLEPKMAVSFFCSIF